MRRAIIFLCAVVVTAMIGVAPAGADIDRNPNAFQFGPATCEDGSYFDNLYSPGGVVGQQVGTNVAGVNHLIWLVEVDEDTGEASKFAPLGDPLSPGLARLTVFCWWEDSTSPTEWIGGDILFGGHGRP